MGYRLEGEELVLEGEELMLEGEEASAAGNDVVTLIQDSCI